MELFIHGNFIIIKHGFLGDKEMKDFETFNNKIVNKLKSVFFGVGLGLLTAMQSFGQTANIYGHVGSKPSNTDLAGAKIEIINPNNNQTLDTKITDAFGNYNSVISDVRKVETLPNNLSISQNWPNPFNPTTNVNVSVPSEGNYTFELINVLAQLIDKESSKLSRGTHTFTFSTPSAGIYFYRVSGNNFSITKKAVSEGNSNKEDYITLEGKTGGFLGKVNSVNAAAVTLDSLIVVYSAEDHITKQMKVPAVDQEINVWLEQTPVEEINFDVKTYDTMGDIAQPTFEYVWGDGSVDTLFADQNGVVVVDKKFYDSVTDRIVSITQINPEYTLFQTYLDTSKTEMNHITENWPTHPVQTDTTLPPPKDIERPALLDIDQAEALGTIESYSIPKYVDGYDMDGSFIRSIIGRTVKYPQDYLSKFMPSEASDTTDIFLFREEFTNNSNIIDPVKIEYTKEIIENILKGTILKNGKKLLKYKFHLDDNDQTPAFEEVFNRGEDNLARVQFDNSNVEPHSGVNTTYDPNIPRIGNSYAAFNENSSKDLIRGIVFQIFTNTQNPFGVENPQPENRLEKYIFNEDGTLNNLGKHIFGINYTSLPGREY